MTTQCNNNLCQPAFTQRVFKAPNWKIVHSLAVVIGRTQRLHLVRARLLANAVNGRHAETKQSGKYCEE